MTRPGRSAAPPQRTPSATTPVSRLSPSRPQASLRVSEPSDPYEREADRVADRVMRMTGDSVMRACSCDDDEVRRSSSSANPVDGGFTVRRADATPTDAGRPLDPTTRTWAERAFGDDFTRVRVYTGDRDACAAETIGARAYTLGSDIVFGPGRYRPATATGRHLLAHELTHVLQQRSASEPPVVRRSRSNGAERALEQFSTTTPQETCTSTGHRSTEVMTLTPRSLDQLAGVVAGQSRSLTEAERATLEPALGHDLEPVRVHTGLAAHRSASALDARAFTVGHHIVLGRDADHSARDVFTRVLAHEAAHVVQQTGRPDAVEGLAAARHATASIARLDPSDCATDCTTPAGTDGPTGKYRLVVYADKDSTGPFVFQAFTSKVGHSWLKLVDPSGSFWYYGFWPQEGFDPGSPFEDVSGCVWTTASQGGHEATSKLEFVLTAEQFAAAKDLAQTACADRPDYNLFGLQCTEFVKRVMEAAGVGPVGGFGLIIESPNALDAMLAESDLLVGLNVRAAGTGPEGRGAVSLDVEGRAELAATLGKRLRLYALGRGELGGGMAYVGGGLGVTLRPRSPYLPSARIYGGFAEGDVTPGRLGDDFGVAATGSASLEYRLDELLAIGAEYNVLADVARVDPVVQRFLVSLRVPF